TDVVQSVVLLLGGMFCLYLLLTHMPGGWEQLGATAARHDKFALGSMDADLLVQGFWVIFIFGIVENLKNFSVDQNYVQRFLSAPSEAQAKRSLWLGGLLYIPVSALFFMIGTALFVYYLNVPAAGLPEQADKVFPYFIVNELPTGLVGLVIAGVLAAGMSTLDSSLNSSATVWTVDFYKRLLRPDADDARQVTVIRATTAIIGVLATAASLLMIDAKSALDVWWKLSAVFGGGMLGLFLCALFYRHMQPRQAMFATAVGVLFVAWATITSTWFIDTGWGFPLHVMMIGACGTLVIVVAGFLVSRQKRS
ncbi:MAG: sodium:solute symporter, partial [Gammaproteobacteria bacterium]|nr:sodium:solute symporter [Gammaproteobacteria bacterium]